MATIIRLKLIDVTGYFPIYTFEINPTEYKPLDDKKFISIKNSISGNKSAQKFTRVPTRKAMSWTRITRVMYKELEKRYKSSNEFVLQDHNYKVAERIDSENRLNGCIVDFKFDEITSTVPSAYKGSLVFEGVGKE